jgi:hypothetical protein
MEYAKRGGGCRKGGSAPCIGAFTFGEQGPVPGVGNRHQNLIQNILIFGKNESKFYRSFSKEFPF